MPFESVTCPECSATDGIIKVEPDTYYCPYHKGLFKYVEPRAVTGQPEVSFCQCGHVAQGSCDLCGKLTCGDCAGQTIVPVRGCGYLYPRKKGKPEKRATLAEAMQAVHMYKVMFAGHDGRQFDLGVGPVLYRDEILSLLMQGRKMRSCVCNSCLTAGWRATLHAIASGQMCERPACTSPPTSQCGCCHA